MTSSYEHAVRYLERGWSIIPLEPRGKKAIIPWKPFQTRLATLSEVESWFELNPAANLGVVTGRISGLTVLDLDGPEAEEVIVGAGHELPNTPTAITARGRHLYFEYVNAPGITSSASVRNQLDIRHDGGYVVAPPSIHASGATYAWASEYGRGFEAQPATLPRTLHPLIVRDSKSAISTRDAMWSPRVTAEELLAPIAQGRRNAQLTRLAGALFADGLDADEVLGRLLEINQRQCDPPLNGDAVATIVTSIHRRERSTTRFASIAPARFVTRSMDTVKPEETNWLWHKYIPTGGITIWDGVPGIGKSTATLDLAARVSNGSPMPDGTAGIHGGVVLFTVEDSLERTVRPRLEAAGARLDRIHTFEGIPSTENDVESRLPTLPRDIPKLAELIQSVGARLVVIDPLMAFLDASICSWKDQDVRSALAPLTRMADALDVAVLVVRHPTKNREASALDAGSGSIGIVASARAVFYLGKDPTEDQVVLAPVKQNLSREVRSLAFEIVTAANGLPRIEWLGESEHTAADLRGQTLEKSNQRTAARRFLREFLATGPREEKEVREAAKTAGISDSTLKRARNDEGVTSSKKGFTGGWEWRYPNQTTAAEGVADLTSFEQAALSYQSEKGVSKKIKKILHTPDPTGTVGPTEGGGYGSEISAFSDEATHGNSEDENAHF